jgi:hypothetical protein
MHASTDPRDKDKATTRYLATLTLAEWRALFFRDSNLVCQIRGIPVSRADRRRALAVLPGGRG